MADAKQVFGVEHVELARTRQQTQIEISPGDIITDLARESALRLGISFVSELPVKPAIASTDSTTRTQRELFRRSPKWVAPKIAS